MLIGLLSGAAAALLAGLLSLPLQSPDDAFLNTASVTIAALVAGVAAGLLRGALSARSFAIAWGEAFIVVVAAIAASESQFERMISFGLPLAAVVFGVTGLGVAFLAERPLPRMPAITAGTVVVAAVFGLGLASRGDAETGTLALPPVASTASTSSSNATAVATGSAAASGTALATASAPGGLPSAFTTPADVKNVTFVVGTGSQSTFTVNEKLTGVPLPNDAVLRDTALVGDIHLDGQPTKITIDLQKLTSDQSRRDTFVRQMFRTHPTAVFTVPSIAALPARYEVGQTVKQSVSGTLAINGVERPIAFNVEARLDGTTLNVHGTTSFVWKDFDITPPNTPTVQVQDRVAVEVLLIARAQAG